MCYKPLHIVNPKHDFDKYRDKHFLNVPCGKCSDCIKRKHAEWFCRSYYEYKRCIDNGGFVLYFTLTYRPACLPKINDKACFSKRDIQLFLKRLRKKYDFTGLKYLITSEYGGKTFRPHYHGLLFVPQEVNLLTLKYNVWKSWRNGFTNFGREGDGRVFGAGAIFYTTKYITKDLDFINEHLDTQIPKECLPFHLQSTGFGDYIIEKYHLNNCDQIVDFFANDQIEIPIKDKPYIKFVPIPMYIKRKLLFDVDYVFSKKHGKFMPLWSLNQIGKDVVYKSFDNRLAKVYKEFIELTDNINNILHDSKRLDLFNKNAHSDFATSSCVRLWFKKIDLKALSIYSILYNSYLLTPDYYDFNVDFLQDLFKSTSIYGRLKFLVYGHSIILSSHENKVSTLDNTFNYFDSLFTDFSLALSLLCSLRYVQGLESQEQYNNQLNSESDLKLINYLNGTYI